MTQQALVGQGLFYIEASRSHSDTSNSLGFLWTSDHPVAETSTLQYTSFRKTDIHAFGVIRTRSPSKLEAADKRLRPRGHWVLSSWIAKLKCTASCKSRNVNNSSSSSSSSSSPTCALSSRPTLLSIFSADVGEWLKGKHTGVDFVYIFTCGILLASLIGFSNLKTSWKRYATINAENVPWRWRKEIAPKDRYSFTQIQDDVSFKNSVLNVD